MNRRGVFFTLVVIAAISLFLISYTFYKNYSSRDTIHDRVNTLNNFLFSVEENLERQIFISGFRSIFIMQKESIENGFYISNVSHSLNELFFNGTFNSVDQPIMLGATFSDLQVDILQKANKINADIFLSNPSIFIRQSDPWNIEVVFNVELNAQDQGNLVRWNKTQTYYSKIPIKDFEDPLYLLNTGGAISNKIIQTPFTNFTSGSSTANLNNHTSSKYYKSNPQAPSYLNRLQGSNLADENGIESFVYSPQLSNQGITPKDKSLVDYIYFSSDNPISCRITGMPSWFKVDQQHLDDYGLNGLEHSCN